MKTIFQIKNSTRYRKYLDKCTPFNSALDSWNPSFFIHGIRIMNMNVFFVHKSVSKEYGGILCSIELAESWVDQKKKKKKKML
jgi:hypothetical protein